MNLFENWTETKEVLLEGLSDRKKSIMAPLLENQKKYIAETQTAMGDVSNFQKIMMPMMRRIIPNTLGTELVGVQPMSGPVGLAYSLRFLFAEEGGNITAGDLSETGGLVGGAGGLAGNQLEREIWNPHSTRLQKFYSTLDASGSATQDVWGTAGVLGSTNAFENQGGRSLKLEVLKQTVTAGSRKLQAKWTVEATQDLSSQHGLDLEAEITAALSAEITNEIDREIIDDLLALAGTVEAYDMAGTFTGTPTFIGDRHAVLGVLINKVANEIARKTRRSAANWIVVSPMVASVLQSATKSVFAPAVAGSFDAPTGTKLIGTLNGSIKVYTYVYHTTGTEDILVGYKGGSGEMDTGYFYCPYIPLTSSNIVIDPVTFNPRVSLMTRYGKATFVNSKTSLGQSADYYGRVSVANLTFM